MRIDVCHGSRLSVNTELLVVPVIQKDLNRQNRSNRSKSVKSPLAEIGTATGDALFGDLKRNGFSGKGGETYLLRIPPRCKARAILLVGMDGARRGVRDSLERIRKLGTTISTTARANRYGKVVLDTQNFPIEDNDALLAFFEGLLLSQYTFTKYRTKKETSGSGITEIRFFGVRVPPRKAFLQAKILSDATALARNLVNTPPSDCTPTFLVKTAIKSCQRRGVRSTVFNKKRLTRMGAGGILSVAQGTEQPPYILKLVYKPSGRVKKVLSIVGKGITFDSGGLSIKPAAGMMTMKCDMGGAAAVIGAMQAISLLKPKIEVRAYIPTTENMISGRATRPGDVTKAMNGKTIEILNTDAEGRLILADALTLADRDGCDAIVDLATLTGACAVALGSDYAGLFTDSDSLARSLLTAGDLAGERLWRMPLPPEYREHIKSSVADIKNTGAAGGYGGAITAALFLKEFVGKTPWAHLDIAGPAFTESDRGYIKKGGVGFGVRTLVHYILSEANKGSK